MKFQVTCRKVIGTANKIVSKIKIRYIAQKHREKHHRKAMLWEVWHKNKQIKTSSRQNSPNIQKYHEKQRFWTIPHSEDRVKFRHIVQMYRQKYSRRSKLLYSSKCLDYSSLNKSIRNPPFGSVIEYWLQVIIDLVIYTVGFSYYIWLTQELQEIQSEIPGACLMTGSAFENWNKRVLWPTWRRKDERIKARLVLLCQAFCALFSLGIAL